MEIFSKSVEDIVKSMPLQNMDYRLKEIAASNFDFRISIIDSQGVVIADSDAIDTEGLENHILREEIKKAFAGEIGVTIRRSTLNNKDVLYYAIPVELENQQFALRLSIPIDTNIFSTTDIALNFILTGIIVLLLILIFSLLVSFHVVNGIKKLKVAAECYKNENFDFIPDINSPGELQDLSESLQNMAKTLQKNIKDIKEKKDELEAIFSGITEGLIVFDNNNVVCGCNQTAANFFLTTETEVIGKKLSNIINNEGFFELVQSKKTDEIIVQIENDLFDNLIISAKCIPLVAYKNEQRFILVMQDVSKLFRLEKIRKDFVANVSHELKTPITSIRGFAETLMDGAYKEPEVAYNFIKIIDSQSARLQNIIQDLLTLSNIEQQEKSLELIPCNIVEIIKNICSSFVGFAKQKNIKITFNSSDKNLFVEISEGLFCQAIGNIIQNSIKYCPENSLVECIIKQQGDYVKITIQDNGAGIPEQYKKRIFERFFRVDKGRSRQMGGTGLGLSIASHIFTVHHGFVNEVGRKDGKSGACFEIILPLCPLAMDIEIK